MFFEASKSHRKMDSRLILVVIGVIVMAFGRSEALIDCYSCDSNPTNNTYCRDPFSSTGVDTAKCIACRKYYYTDEDTTTFTRDCYDDPIEGDECAKSTLDDKTTVTCLCNSDKCNDGQLVKPTSYKVIIGAAMATVMAIARMNQS
jgi:hypothetical protein